MLENDVAGYITAVGYDSGIYKTIGASHELGGLQGNNFNSYIDGILNFFDQGGNNPNPECILGDVNSDNIIDIIDIIRVVNIIINTGDPVTDLEICAADLNIDGSIDILDVLIMINMILD